MTDIHVEGKPPYKQSPADYSEKKNQQERRDILHDNAKRACLEPLKGSVKLIINYRRYRGMSDAANIIGGIADALENILYEDDKQIGEILYSESNGNKDEYWVKVEPRE